MFVFLHELGHSQQHRNKRNSLAFSSYGSARAPGHMVKLEREADHWATDHLDTIDFVSYDDSDVIWDRPALVRRILGEVNAEWWNICRHNDARRDRIVHLKKYIAEVTRAALETSDPLQDLTCGSSPQRRSP